MATNEELENFRKKWKEEVSNNLTISKIENENRESTSSGSHFPHPAYRETTSTVSACKTLDFSRDQNSKCMTYYPFNIVGNLLKSSSSQRSSDTDLDENADKASVNTSTDETVVSATGKRKRKHVNDNTKEEGKRAKLKDIFSLRKLIAKGSKERILDAFIADLVWIL